MHTYLERQLQRPEVQAAFEQERLFLRSRLAFRPLGHGIYEVRTALTHNRVARVLFYIDRKSRMVLLHGFIKKTQRTPEEDLALARKNKEKHDRGHQVHDAYVVAQT